MVLVWGAAVALAATVGLQAHNGSPFPLVSNQVTGPYRVSVWADPDATDDGTPAGTFWVLVEGARKDTTLPVETRVTLAITPRDRPGPTLAASGRPTGAQVPQRFIAALLMNHEGPYAVAVAVDGPLGSAHVDTQVDATYATRPGPIGVILSLVPFLLAGGLWLKLLLRRRAAAPRPQA